MNPGKILIALGVVSIIIGLLWSFFGKLPGDFIFKKGNTTIYFPFVTSVIASIFLTLIFFLIGKFTGR